MIDKLIESMKKQDYNKSIEVIQNIATAKLITAVPLLRGLRLIQI